MGSGMHYIRTRTHIHSKHATTQSLFSQCPWPNKVDEFVGQSVIAQLLRKLFSQLPDMDCNEN